MAGESEDELFHRFLWQSGWVGVGYSLDYYPEWVRRYSFREWLKKRRRKS